jgi:serine/threonine protein kinase
VAQKNLWREKVLQIENLYQTRSFVDRCQQLTCEGEDLIQFVSWVEQYRTQIDSNIYYSKGQKIPELDQVAPCDFQRIVNPASGGPEQLVVYPCADCFAKGSFKKVSLAFDYLSLKRKVKIKVRDPHSPETLYELKAEALLVQVLSGHNGLLHAYDESKVEDPRYPYILTQDFYRGTLEDYQTQLSEYGHYQISQDLLEGLSYLHAKDWIHRDIKPENIFIQYEGGTFRAVFGDYGLMVQDNQRPQETLMSWAYLPPEATNFLVQVQSKAFDVWSLGVSLLEMRQNFNVSKRCGEGFNQGSNPRKIKDPHKYCEAELHAAIQPSSQIDAVDAFFRLNEKQKCARKSAVQFWISQCAASAVRNPLILTTLDDMICTMLIPNSQCRITTPEALEAMKTICSKNPEYCK